MKIKLGPMQRLSWYLPGLTRTQRLEVVKLFKAEYRKPKKPRWR